MLLRYPELKQIGTDDLSWDADRQDRRSTDVDTKAARNSKICSASTARCNEGPAAGAAGEKSGGDQAVSCEVGRAARNSVASLNMEVVERALHMKLTGYLNAVQAAMPHLTERGSITSSARHK
jgi:hypothetical protein